MALAKSLIVDIETVPDLDTGRRVYDLPEMEDGQTAEVMFNKTRNDTVGKTDFLPLYLHKVATISAVFVKPDAAEPLKVSSFGDEYSSEQVVVEAFYKMVERELPVIVTWNGRNFDMPVLHLRAMYYGISAPLYWDKGTLRHEFRYDNYHSRFHERHLDLMDQLSAFGRGIPLQDVSVMLGLPGKMGVGGGQVWDAWHEGRKTEVREYCELDVVNTFLVYIHFELMRGRIDRKEFEYWRQAMADYLDNNRPKNSLFGEYLQEWRVQ